MPRDVLPPLPFRPIPMPRPWGGRRAAELLGLDADRFGASGEPIGEWWLVSGRPDHASRVVGGPCDGRSLVELVAADPAAIVGTSASEPARRRFPLLLKVLDTADPLSVQVHPSDAELQGEGKTETWYVIASEPGASFWLGLARGRKVEEVFEVAARGDAPIALLARHEAAVGTLAHLVPGMLHALGAGILAVEFQTSADTTYRIWDWNRMPARPLHLAEARRVARARQEPRLLVPEPRPGSPPGERLVECDDYRVERLFPPAKFELPLEREHFEILLPLGATIRVATGGGTAEVPPSHAVLLPASPRDDVVRIDWIESRTSPGAGSRELLRFQPGPKTRSGS